MFENIAELFHLNLLKKIVFSFRAQSARPGSSCCDTKKHKFYQLARMFGHVDVPVFITCLHMVPQPNLLNYLAV